MKVLGFEMPKLIEDLLNAEIGTIPDVDLPDRATVGALRSV